MRKFLTNCLLLLVLVSQINAATYTITESRISTSAISFDTTNPYQCSCDLYEYSCDDLCCCDTECSTSTINSWKAQGICQSEAGGHHFCSLEGNAFQLVKVADRNTITHTKFNNATGKGICVDVSSDNSEYQEMEFITNSQLTMTKALELIANDKSQYSISNPQTSSRTYTFGYNFLLGDGSYLTLPVPDAFGNCDTNYKARFGVNEDERSCDMPLTQTSCTSDTRLSAANITNDQTFRSSRATTTTMPTYMYQLNRVNSVTKAMTTTFSANLTTNAVSDLTTVTPALTVSGSTCTCSNVMTGIQYIMNLGATVLDNVHTVITVSDISFDCASGTSISQTSSLVNVALDSQIPLSGRRIEPGYLVGNPLRIGTVSNSNSRSINTVPITNLLYRVTGIDVNGNCLDASSATSTIQDPISFGQDTSFSCSLTVTAANFANFCGASGTSNWRTLGLWNNFVPRQTAIGQFANANPNYISDFVRVTGTNPAQTSLTNANNICQFYSESTVNIYWSTVGYYESYQNYIAAARVTFDQQRSVSTLVDADLTFVLKVNFVNIDEAVEDFSPGARPTIIPQLPRDILYPIFYPTEASASIVHMNFALLSIIFIFFALLF